MQKKCEIALAAPGSGRQMGPTTKDLANHLGMSRSTVDRVLNGRPGVKKATVDAVNKAIEELGFVRNISAANLAKQRVYRLVFLLPKAEGDFVHELEEQVKGLSKVLQPEAVEIKVRRVIENDQQENVALLSRLSTKTTDGVAVMAPETPQVRDALLRLSEQGIHVVRIVSGKSDTASADFVGIDNVSAGRTAARLLGGFCGHQSGHVVVVTDRLTSTDSVERRLGFDRAMQENFQQLNILPTLEMRGDPKRALAGVRKTFESFADIRGVYILASEAAFALDALDRLAVFEGRTVIAHERTPTSIKYLSADKVDALIAQDSGHIIRSAARILKARCDGRSPFAVQNEIRIEILLKENLGLYAGRDGGPG